MILVRIVIQTVGLALGQIWSNKVASLLTTLGVIIGVASVIAVIAALQGLRSTVLNEFEKLGAKRVYIDGDLPQSMRGGGTSWLDVQLKLEEIEAIRERCASITSITPEYWGSYSAEYGEIKIDSAPALGIWPTWHDIVGRQVVQGRQFVPVDDSERRFVCLVNDKAIEELDLPREPVGEFIRLGGRRFQIVGVVETIQLNLFGGGDSQTEIFIPFETARTLDPNGWINQAWGSLASPKLAEDAKVEIAFVLRKMRELTAEDESTFRIEVFQSFIDQFNALAAGITAGAGGIVGISLLVGGIGIMNIMLVSVSERTREIGLRKAIGARPIVILIQFLVEAVTLCLVGGAIGLAVGQGLISLLRAVPASPLKDASVPAWAVLLAVGFSAGTGVVFGMFPAIKAARLDPIEALRHD